MNIAAVLVILSFWLSGCSRPALPEGKVPKTLALAFDKISLVSGDRDAGDVLTDRLVLQAVDFRDFKVATEKAVELTGAQRGQTLAMLAWDASNCGYEKQAKDLIRLAITDSWIISDSDRGKRDAFLAGAEMRLGHGNESKRIVNLILDPQMKAFANDLVMCASFARDPEAKLPDHKGIRQDAVQPLTRALFYSLENSNLTSDQKVSILHLIEKVIPGADPQTAVSCWSRLAILEQNYHLFGEVFLSAAHAKQIAQAIDPRTEGYAIALKDAAIALLATGDREEALKCLEYASAKPEIIAYFFQPEAMMAVAEGYEKAGEKEKANAFWLRAIQTAKSHPHPRARQINVVLLLSYMTRAGVSPTPEVMEVIESIGRGEGGDAPLPPGYVKVGDPKSNPVKAPAKHEKKDKKKKESKVPAG